MICESESNPRNVDDILIFFVSVDDHGVHGEMKVYFVNFLLFS